MVQALRIQQKTSQSREDRQQEDAATALVNPASGIANDYLNLFNEIVMLIEQLPTMPELIEDIKAWRPTTYREYFAKSPLPGSGNALQAYEKLDVLFRMEFEKIVAELDQQATGIVAAIRLHQRAKKGSDRFELEVICGRGGSALRETLDRAVNVVNDGLKGIERNARARQARLQKIREQSIRDVEDFYNKPRWDFEEDQ
ncbi:MAG: hypothetical protein AB7F96_01900 [Beijerinckiaceae bacterium]